MFPQRVFTDASQESMDAVKIAPNAVLDLQTEPGTTGARATAGVLESTFSVEFNRTGVKVPTVTAAMRYTGAIDTTKLPVNVTGAKWDGLFVKITPNGSPATLLSNAPATAGAGA